MKIQITHQKDGTTDIRDFADMPDCISVGRSDDNDIVLSDMNISRHHAEFILEDGVYWIVDNGSRSGIHVNGQSVIKKKQLMLGDCVNIGAYQLMLQLDDSPLFISKHNIDNISTTKKTEGDSIKGSSRKLLLLPDFLEIQALYTEEMMNLKNKIHTLILEKLNLSETALKDFANSELVEKLEDCLDQTLRELRHELPMTWL